MTLRCHRFLRWRGHALHLVDARRTAASLKRLPPRVGDLESDQTEREKEIFDEMLAALRGVVNWFGMTPDADAPVAIAKAKGAIAKAEAGAAWRRDD